VLPAPASGGRIYTGRRRVRLGDSSPGGRLRLDAAARYLQDVSNDDTDDAELGDDAWVVRRTVVDVPAFPVLGEALALTTFCTGTGARWAERRVRIDGVRGGAIDAVSLWVHIDLASGRPTPLTARFHELYGPAAGGRTVRARLTHGDPPAGVDQRQWSLRFTDFDVMGHMNNAAYWAVVEEELARRRDLRCPLRAEMEFRAAVEQGDEVHLVDDDAEGHLWLWLRRADGTVCASAHVWRTA
jgi:acyl-ACP thioesterase